MIEVICTCGRKLHARPEHAGMRAKCPGCGKHVTVPKPDDDLRILGEEPELASAATKSPSRVCKQHPTLRAVGKCAICGTPICSECRSLLGYYCSPEHKAQSRDWKPNIAEAAASTSEADRQAQDRAALQFKIIKFAALGLAAVIVLYFVGSWLFIKGGSVAWEADLKGEIPLMLLSERDEIRMLTQAGKMQAFDSDGDPGPERDIGINPERRASLGGIVKGTAILSDGSKLTGVSLANGETAWTYPAKIHFGWSTQLIHNDDLLFLTIRKRTEELEDGDEKNKLRKKALALSALIEDTFFACDPISNIIALDARTGKEAWNIELKEPSFSLNIFGGKGHVYLRSADPGENKEEVVTITAYSTSEGHPLWKLSSTETRILSEPLPIAAGLLVVTESGLKCLKHADGSEAWSLPLDLKVRKKSHRFLGRTFQTDDSPLKNLSYLDDALYLHVKTELRRLDPSSGREVWKKEQNAIIGDLLAAGEILVAEGATEKDVAAAIEKDPFIAGSEQLATIMREEMGGGKTYVPITFGIHPETGERLWASRLSGKMIPTRHGLVVAKTLNRPNLFARIGGPLTDSQGMLRMIDPWSGKTSWEYVLDGDLNHPVAAGDQIVFVMTSGTSFDPDAEGFVMKAKESKLISIWIK